MLQHVRKIANFSLFDPKFYIGLCFKKRKIKRKEKKFPKDNTVIYLHYYREKYPYSLITQSCQIYSHEHGLLLVFVFSKSLEC